MSVRVIEDAEEGVESITLCLTMRWPRCVVQSAVSGKTGLMLLAEGPPDLVLLDLTLSDGQGLTLLDEIRTISNVPLLVISGTADETTRVKSLEHGADDYITKPFSHTELLARINAVLRRSGMQGHAEKRKILAGGNLVVDLSSGRVFASGQEAKLSGTEWRVLEFLTQNAGRVVPAAALATHVWGSSPLGRSTIKMCIRRLRQKLGDSTRTPRIIRGHRGRGYSLDLNPP